MTDEQTPTRPSVMIATPMYGGMCTGVYVQGVLRTVNKLRELKAPVFWAHIMNESLITRARNELVHWFLENKYDYLMFVDADIGFDETAVLQLLAADKDVVCGLYPKKEIDWKQVSKAAREGKDNLQDYGGSFVFNMIGNDDAETDETGCIEVRHGGTGFMLIKREVFETMKSHVKSYINDVIDLGKNLNQDRIYEFFPVFIDEQERLLSEDYAFCRKARDIGYKVYAAPWVQLGHFGTYLFEGGLLPAP